MTDLIALEVPFPEKDEAKSMGATWDPTLRKWCVPSSRAAEFARWFPYNPTPAEVISKLPIDIPQAHKQAVRVLSQTCEYQDWLLLMLPEKRWGAFWTYDLETPAATAIFEGRYDDACRFVGDSPLQTLEYMRDNQIHYDDPVASYVNEDIEVLGAPGEFCRAELRIAGRTIALELPAICASMAEHLDSESPLSSGYSPLALALYDALDKRTPDSTKPPSIADQASAAEISRCLREPMPAEALEIREACREFIVKHREDMTLYRNIYQTWHAFLATVAADIRNYARWTLAREQMSRGESWEDVAASLGIKTKATIERYVANAEAYEKENAEWVASPFIQRLLEAERNGENVHDLLMHEMDSQSYNEFRRERRARQLLSKQGPAQPQS